MLREKARVCLRRDQRRIRGGRGRSGGCGRAGGGSEGNSRRPRISFRWRLPSSASGIFWRSRPGKRRGTVHGAARSCCRNPPKCSFRWWRRESERKRRGIARRRNIERHLRVISELRPAVDFFFDKVLVMAEDEEYAARTVSRCWVDLLKGIFDDRGFFGVGWRGSSSNRSG